MEDYVNFYLHIYYQRGNNINMEPTTYGTLYLCATPIGNLEDMTPRALRMLQEADLIAAEDTRHTLQLLNHFGIKGHLIRYDEHSKEKQGAYLLDELLAGKNVALVSDAGFPGIADPGEALAKDAIAAGVRVVPVPGANAALCALIASGLPAYPFFFGGFLPKSKKNRREQLEQWKYVPATMILYEAPHRIEKYVGLEHIESGQRTTEKYDSSENVLADSYIFQKGDLLYSKLRPYLDKCIIADFDGICTTELIVYDTKDNASKEYILNILHSKSFLDYIVDKGFGTKMPRVSHEIVSNYDFYLPLESEQKELLGFIDKINNCAIDIKSQIAKSQEVKQEIINKIF